MDRLLIEEHFIHLYSVQLTIWAIWQLYIKYRKWR